MSFDARFKDGKVPPKVRFSTLLADLRRLSGEFAAREFEREKEACGSHCITHGRIEDPIVAILDSNEGPRVAYACPQCSGEEVRAAWEREGREQGV